jgi:hypothetical protein
LQLDWFCIGTGARWRPVDGPLPGPKYWLEPQIIDHGCGASTERLRLPNHWVCVLCCQVKPSRGA